MISFDRFQSLWSRLRSYDFVEVAIEFVLIWLVVYSIVIFVRGTRAAGALKGLLVILTITTVIARLLGQGQSFQRVSYLYDKFLGVAAIGLIVVFQPELRRALVKLGETPLFQRTPAHIAGVVDAIADACAYLSKSKFGAIIAIERQATLRGLVEDGTTLNAEISAGLLQTLFFPGTALHDLAVHVKGNRILQAGVQLPLAEPAEMSDPRLGSRHRAAVGLTKECDAVVVVVSEETGQIRVAERGRLSEELSADELRQVLIGLLRATPSPARRASDAAAGHEAGEGHAHEPSGENGFDARKQEA